MKTKLPYLLFMLAALAGSNHAFAQGTGFTYQGRLNVGANAANGLYDFQFSLSNAPSGGSQVGSTITNLAIGVTNGLFAANLDFGVVFNGNATWLALKVRTNGVGSFSPLVPLTQLLPTPYAIMAGSASNLLGALPAAQLSGIITSANMPASPIFSGTVSAAAFSGSGASLTALNANNLASGTVPLARLSGITSNQLDAATWQLATNNGAGGVVTATNAWQLGGNIVVAGQFIGSVNNQPVEVRVNGARAWRLEPGISGHGAPNMIGGSSMNNVGGGVDGATIGGGGATNYFGQGFGYFNNVTGYFGTVGGGAGNTAGSGEGATVGGGEGNTASGTNALVGGGTANQATALNSTVGGGQGNAASGHFATVSGGYANTASLYYSAVGGGYFNMAINNYATIAGGSLNTASGTTATVSGGESNIASGEDAFIGGGDNNIAAGLNAMVGGGSLNTASGEGSTVSGGDENKATNTDATVGGGFLNVAGSYGATVGGGLTNFANGVGSTVGGGGGNSAGIYYSTIGGGTRNNAAGNFSTISGGFNNTVSGLGATVCGGLYNVASGDASFAAGDGASATNSYAFVWGDNSALTTSTANNQFMVRASGGAIFYSSSGTAGAQLLPNQTTWSAISDRNAKKNFQPVNAVAVLNKLAATPIQEWNYKWENDTDVPNIGPMAQDFKAAFYPGRDDKSISTLEFDGVELAAIQGLNQKLEEQTKEKDAEIQDLKQSVADLKKMVQSLVEKK